MNRNTQRSLVEAASRVLREDIDSFVFSHDDDEGNYIRTPGTPINPPGYGIRPGSLGSGGIGGLGKGNPLNPGSHDTSDHQPSYPYGPNHPSGGWVLDNDGLFYWWNWNNQTRKYERDPNSQGIKVPNGKRNPGQWYSYGGRWDYRIINGIRYPVWVPSWEQQPRGSYPIGTIRNNDEYSTVDWYNPLSWPNRFRDDIIW